MKKVPWWHKVLLVLFCSAAVFFAAYVSKNLAQPRAALAGLNENVNGYAWSENIGWISFNCLNTDACGLVDYGVNIDSDSGFFSGYAWSEHIGWVHFAPIASRDDPYPSEPFGIATLNFDTGQVTGWARACAVFAAGCSGELKPSSERDGWDGWIKMAGQSFNERRELLASWNVVRTTIGPGVCQFEGYAWGGEVMGWINFRGTNYGVNTSLCNAPPDVTVGSVVNSPDIQIETSPVEYLPIDWLDFETIQTSFVPPDLPDLQDMLDFADMEFSDLYEFTFPDLTDFLLDYPFEEFEAPEELDLEEMMLDAGQECLDAIFARIDAETALAEAQAGGDGEEILAAQEALLGAQASEEALCDAWDEAEQVLELAELRLDESWSTDGPIAVNYCTFPLRPTLSWNFSDLDPGDSQSAYQVQIATRKHFQEQFIVVDSGKVASPLSSYTVPDGALSFDETYYWRVRAWDSTDRVSNWTEGPAYIAPPHAFPQPRFTVLPQNPAVGAATAFTDASEAAVGRIVRWRWRFQDAIPGVLRTQNAQTVFQTPGVKNVSLEVTDADGLTCSTDDVLPQNIRITGPVEFREI